MLKYLSVQIVLALQNRGFVNNLNLLEEENLQDIFQKM